MRKRYDGYDKPDDWSAAAAIVCLFLLICGLFWWPLVLYSWHYWVG